MTTLGSIEKIEYNITHGSLKAVKALHMIAFGNEGQPRKIRKALRAFSGFGLDKTTETYATKVDNVKKDLELADLIAVCNILDLDYSGTNNDVAVRICSFLTNLEKDKDDEDVEEEEEEDVIEDVVEDVEDEENEDVNVRMRYGRKTDSFALTFRDVEDSIRTFDGKDDYPVTKWITDFEEIADVTGWNELQKLLFAKKSLRGLAKLYVQSEKGIKSWSKLKQLLIQEFEIKVSSAQIHKLLMSRRKKREESVQEYVLTMREIGSRANIEAEVVIQYIIEGIQDDVSNKIVLYGAKHFADFKEKVKLYESIKSGRHAYGQQEFKNKKDRDKGVKREEVKEKKEKPNHCFNCGDKGHKSRDCPDKTKGTKCFSCNGYGHVATKCPKKVEKDASRTSTSASISTIEVVPKNAVQLRIDEVELTALLDTGSDISAIREDIYTTYFQDILLDEETIILRGLGPNKVATVGSFSKNVVVNDEEFTLKFHVIPTNTSNFKAIIGSDLLTQAEVSIRDDGIVLYKKPRDNFMMKISVDNQNDDDDSEVDLNHIEDVRHKEVVKELIKTYEPAKTKTTDIEMKIILKSEEPIYQSPRRLSVPEKIEVEKQLEEWLDEEIIRPSSSDYSSPIVLVKKKDGKTRICCDYRKLNRNIVKDRFPLPLIEDVLDSLQDAKVFSTIDLKNGFFHVAVAESSIKYTSFVTHNGQYEFLKCPFGLCNSPAVFQRFISHIFRPLTLDNIAIYYMDDIIIPSSNEDEGIERLKLVLKVARDYGLEIKKRKCQFLKRRVDFLGFIVENGKVQPSEAKTMAIRNFPEPTTCKQIQSFLGLTGYFRKFIPSYARIVKALSDLLRKDQPFVFEDDQRQAFLKLKDLLSEEPVLHIYKQGSETELHTDASKHGYGACLLQRSTDDQKFHPVYYMSKKTTPAEEKYSSYELEVLAIIQAVKKFRIYLLGTRFKIVTDCSAFQRTMDKKDLTTRVARWALLLEEYDYVIDHRRGNQMSHVDALSRYPSIMTITEEEGIINRIKLVQEKDEHIQAIKRILEKEKYKEYFMKHDIVYIYEDGRELLVVPRAMQTEIIRRAHEVGHFAARKTEEIIKREFYIPKLKDKINQYVRNCVPCILGSRKEGKKEGFLHPLAKQEGPLHTYHTDHLGPMMTTNKSYKHILAVVDDFSKFTWLYPTKSATAQETVMCLMRQQVNFGNPSRIITDKGTAFTAKEFTDYCKDQNIQHVTITTGVPRGNGQVERIHRTVIPVLTKLSLDDPGKWFKYVDRVQRALNSTFQRSIEATPFEILIGVKMRNKEDLLIKEMIEKETVMQFCSDREEQRLRSKHQILKVQEENRKGYNLRRKKAARYRVGDLVAIKRTQFGTGLKLQRKYLGPYEIVKVNPNERYDVIKVGDHEGPIRTSTCAEYIKKWIADESDSEESEADSVSDGRM